MQHYALIISIAIVTTLCVICVLKIKVDIERFEEHMKHVPGRTIWLYWQQGWEDAPSTVIECAEAWQNLNPQWNIVQVSQSSADIARYLGGSSANATDANADTLALAVLQEHGGVWVNAPYLNSMPLDEWIYDMIGPAGFWVYQLHDCKLMASLKDAYIVRQLKAKRFETQRGKAAGLQDLVDELKLVDLKFKEQWSMVNSASAGAGAAATAHHLPDYDRMIIVTDCNVPDHLDYIAGVAEAFDFGILIYDKCNFCKHIPASLNRQPLRNVGRDLGTIITFIIRNYHNLPSHMVFVPSALQKYDRRDRLIQILDQPYMQCARNEQVSILQEAEFYIDWWDGKKLSPASVRPFKAWYEHFVGPWSAPGIYKKMCFNGIIRTTRSKVLKHSLEFYKTLDHELTIGGDASEAVHYLERAISAIL